MAREGLRGIYSVETKVQGEKGGTDFASSPMFTILVLVFMPASLLRYSLSI